MRCLICWFVLLVLYSCSESLDKAVPPVPYEQHPDRNYTATYAETIEWYRALADAYPDMMRLDSTGTTDAGYPLHTLIVDADGFEVPTDKATLLINNAIHAGEPVGVDASMLLLRDYFTVDSLREQLSQVRMVVIPFYNIGGGLYRNSTTRANQNGPEAYGFRGNAQNLDLNRDFIKADSENVKAFAQVFHLWQPDAFMDNHTSNGADYPYTMTLIATQPDKLPISARNYMTEQLTPALYDGMAARDMEMTPYVYSMEDTPDQGIMAFMDSPRYSSGYASLFGTLSYISEAHMLKPYRDRVAHCRALMEVLTTQLAAHPEQVRRARQEAMQQAMQADSLAVAWALDRMSVDSLRFRGYTPDYKASEVSGLPRLYYDTLRPFEQDIPFYPTYKPTVTVSRPAAYVLLPGNRRVLDYLQLNGIEMRRLTRDTTLTVTQYRITDYQTATRPYEGHYVHYATEVQPERVEYLVPRGSYIIPTQQPGVRYIVETLEPQGTDSFFAWGFYDAILQQKEYFSPYVFEERAAAILTENPDLRAELEAAKAANPDLANSAYAQLKWVYDRSDHAERTFMRYPVLRVE